MNVILLSGGSGKRLWPLSNEARAKQFLKVLKTEDGENISMLQKVFGQILEADIDANITIAAAQQQVDSIRKQLGMDTTLVVEPERRNTYPAIALAVAYLLKEKKASLDEVVVIMPVDVSAKETYFKSFYKMKQAVLEQNANLALLGVKPTYPSAKYGYIMPEKGQVSDKEVYKVQSFEEKPTEEKAAELIK